MNEIVFCAGQCPECRNLTPMKVTFGKRLTTFLAASALAIGLAGCGTLEKQQLSVAALCLTYGTSLKELANYRARLDPTAVAVVESVRKALNPVCLAEKPPSATEAATTAAMAGIGQLATVLSVAKGN